MIIWLDAHLSPAVAAWIKATFGVDAVPVRDLGLRGAKDAPIFEAARAAGAVVMTKDNDFVEILNRFGPPPQVLWVTCGNTSNARLCEILTRVMPTALKLLNQGDSLVEISDAP
jgi:predicted nuclease of predicted toxin-antitoxin system